MAVGISWALICALISPFIWALMNTLDKYVVSKKAKSPISFAVIAGLVNLAIGIILALFLDWPPINFKMVIFPVIAGLVFGSQFFLYYLILKKEDASHSVGLMYTYPILIAILSYAFLGEKLSAISYLGVAMITIGALIISLRLRQISLRTSWEYILSLILAVAAYEFFIKLSTDNLPEFNGLAIQCMFIGLVTLPALFKKRVRNNFKLDLKNVKWSLLNESLTFLALLTTYFAMAGLPVTIVSSIGAIEPLAVLALEMGFSKKLGTVRDTLFRYKIIALILIVIGVAILYFNI